MQQRIASAREVLTRAAKGRYAIGAFNVSELLTLKAVVNAAARLRAPVIVETSSGETAFIGARIQATLTNAYEEQLGLPVLCNLDHAKTYAQAAIGMDAGYAMIHFDGSELPKRQNIALLKRVVRKAHARHLLVEGELDHIVGAGSELHTRQSVKTEQAKGRYTDPEEAAAFVAATGVDLFASFIGNMHGVFRTHERLDLDRLRKIHAAVPCLLTLHGGSGIQPSDVRRAIGLGITKVNVNTELRAAFMHALRIAVRSRTEIAPYVVFPPVVAAVQKVVEQKIRLFGSAGKA